MTQHHLNTREIPSSSHKQAHYYSFPSVYFYHLDPQHLLRPHFFHNFIMEPTKSQATSTTRIRIPDTNQVHFQLQPNPDPSPPTTPRPRLLCTIHALTQCDAPTVRERAGHTDLMINQIYNLQLQHIDHQDDPIPSGTLRITPKFYNAAWTDTPLRTCGAHSLFGQDSVIQTPPNSRNTFPSRDEDEHCCLIWKPRTVIGPDSTYIRFVCNSSDASQPMNKRLWRLELTGSRGLSDYDIITDFDTFQVRASLPNNKPPLRRPPTIFIERQTITSTPTPTSPNTEDNSPPTPSTLHQPPTIPEPSTPEAPTPHIFVRPLPPALRPQISMRTFSRLNNTAPLTTYPRNPPKLRLYLPPPEHRRPETPPPPISQSPLTNMTPPTPSTSGTHTPKRQHTDHHEVCDHPNLCYLKKDPQLTKLLLEHKWKIDTQFTTKRNKISARYNNELQDLNEDHKRTLATSFRLSAQAFLISRGHPLPTRTTWRDEDSTSTTPPSTSE